MTARTWDPSWSLGSIAGPPIVEAPAYRNDTMTTRLTLVKISSNKAR